MLTVTTSQRDSLEAAFQTVCNCVEIDATVPVRMTTWSNAVTYSGDTYLPFAMSVSDVVFDEPQSSNASISVDDIDGTLREDWYAEQFSQFDVNVYQLHRQEDGTWLATQSVTWKCSNCTTKRNGLFTINLTSAGGLRQRAGLHAGSRELFPHAPIAGTPIKLGAVSITVRAGPRTPPPPPGGHASPGRPRKPAGRSGGGGDLDDVATDTGSGGSQEHQNVADPEEM